MKKLLFAALLCVCYSSYGQKKAVPKKQTTAQTKTTIPSNVMKEFGYYANYTFQSGQGSFPAMIYTHFSRKGLDLGQIGIVMENMNTQPVLFNEVIKAIWMNSSKDKNYLYMQFKSFGVSATTANYLAEYCITNFTVTKE